MRPSRVSKMLAVSNPGERSGSVCGSEPVRDLHGAIQALPQSGCATRNGSPSINSVTNTMCRLPCHVVDGDDVGVIEGRHRVGLEFKALTPIRIRCDFLGRIFSATSRFSRRSRARYTSPMPPAPNRAMTSYGPKRVFLASP